MSALTIVNHMFTSFIYFTANEIEIAVTEIEERKINIKLNFTILRKDQPRKINFNRKQPCIYSLLSK